MLKLLDLFCGAGGAAMGYHRAGFEVVGVDNRPQPHYPFEFVLDDALAFVAEHGREFDVVHASPPCQAYSEATPIEYRSSHPDLIGPTREALQATGKPFVIENVENARVHLKNPIMICGSMLGLLIWRHRYFETWPIWSMSPGTCDHTRRPITIQIEGNTRKTWLPIMATGGGDGKGRADRKLCRSRERVDTIRWAMKIDWMTQAELTEAIPPAYTEFVGRQLMLHFGRIDTKC